VAAPSQLPSAQETPATSQAPSEVDVGTATPSSTLAEASKITSPQSQAKKDTRAAVPIVPAVPAVPAARPKTASSEAVPNAAEQGVSAAEPAVAQPEASAEAKPAEPATPAPKAAPKSWADLMRSKNSAVAAASSTVVNGTGPTNGAAPSRASTLAGALKQFNVDDNDKIAFLEPRGLVNTGNMCYMNSVRLWNCFHTDIATNNSQILQILVYCMPFYNFLDQVSKRAAHSFKSDTPLVDAM
jgi:ubiquitin carboxyl-terminal hydrolase 10